MVAVQANRSLQGLFSWGTPLYNSLFRRKKCAGMADFCGRAGYLFAIAHWPNGQIEASAFSPEIGVGWPIPNPVVGTESVG